MAYPEIIPPLKPKEGKEFLERLRSFDLTQEQRDFWADASSPERKAKTKKH